MLIFNLQTFRFEKKNGKSVYSNALTVEANKATSPQGLKAEMWVFFKRLSCKVVEMILLGAFF